MIMDITSLKSGEDDKLSSSKTAVKRSFDVAFLMLPDDKLKRLQNQQMPKVDSRILITKHQVYGDPKPNLQSEQKSAFTKVNLMSKEPRVSPNMSPSSSDVSYQSSLSPSPPISVRNYPLLSPNQIFKNHPYHYENISFTQPLPMENFTKMRPILGQYRHHELYNYNQPEQVIRHPAAAILSTLLPPSLAALSMPAQNVCAKCNISFRMTSDLVYHMRSHHKNDSVDMSRKRREDKLKCPVCAESFRERHHLTRHMTAHQDKDQDGEEPTVVKNFK